MSPARRSACACLSPAIRRAPAFASTGRRAIAWTEYRTVVRAAEHRFAPPARAARASSCRGSSAYRRRRFERPSPAWYPPKRKRGPTKAAPQSSSLTGSVLQRRTPRAWQNSNSMAAVLTSVEAGVLAITLNRPDKLNAFNPEMHKELRRALEQALDENAIHAVLLTGAGRGFCSGQDLGERNVAPGAAPIDLSVTLGSYYNPLVRRLRELPKPIVCAVNGVAAGAGANIALACDIVLAARSARFIQSFARLGLVPDSGGTYFLPRLIGTARATGLALLAEPLSAEDAERWRLIWKVLDDERLMPESTELARRLASGPTKAFGLIKKALLASSGNSLDAQLDLERDLQRDAGFPDDYRKAVAEFLEKRK